MNILALDLGTATGFAWNNGEEFIALTKIWATDKEISFNRKQRMDRRRDPRLVKFFESLRTFCHGNVDLVVFEDVQFQSATMQTQLWASWRTAVWLAFPGTLIDCVPVGTLKKFACNGGATKAQMSAALKRQHPDLWCSAYDDNTIDAIWLWLWAQKNLSRTPLDKSKNSDKLTRV